MITVTKQITLNPGIGETGPYSYAWTADAPVAGCVSFSPSTTGTIINPASQQILTTISFANETCLEDSTITLTITYNNGECVKAFPITVENPCEDFEAGTISFQQVDDYTFTVAPTGGNGPYSYVWSYDETIFAKRGTQSTNVHKMYFIPGSTPPATSSVYVSVTDAHGCSSSSSVDFSVCTLTFDNDVVTALCNPDSTSTAFVCLDPSGCAASLVDWDSLSYNSPVSGITLTRQTSFQNLQCTAQGGRRYRIDVASTVPAGTYTIPYTITTSNGIVSNTAYIYLTVPGCSVTPTSTIVISTQPAFQIDCSYSPTDIYLIGPASAYVTVSGSATPDWTSVQFIPMDTGTPTSGPLTTTAGATVTFNQSTLNFEYEVPAATGTDSFRWTVCDTNGNCSESQIYTLVLDCILTPSAVADSECAVCGEAIEHDVLSNDTINGTLFNLEVATNPSHGSAVFNGSYASPRIIYTPNATYSGSDSYVYTLTNDSLEQDTATVTVNVLCAGTDANISVCE